MNMFKKHIHTVYVQNTMLLVMVNLNKNKHCAVVSQSLCLADPQILTHIRAQVENKTILYQLSLLLLRYK